jgi:D-glycero-D-manno-heptose 1,7-bisphosphate phosphatase
MSAMPRRAVFLDRDGVVNRVVLQQGKPYPPPTLSDLRLLPGVREACSRLHDAGFALILLTNQPDIARGLVSAEQVSEMNQRLQRFLRLDGVGVCPHDDSARCSCRKPQPGLLLEAARVWNIDLESSFIVGDRWRDIEAGHRAGCSAVFVDYGYNEQRPDGPFVSVRSLREAANWILRSTRPGVRPQVA